MDRKEEIRGMIATFEGRIADLRKELAELEAKEEAVSNTMDAMFDGLKYVSSEEKALPLTMPMYVKPNVFYTHGGHTYVCVKAGLLTDGDDFAEYMERWDGEEEEA